MILKFFLHLSNEEQRECLLKRIDTPEKNWKLSASDVHERTFWNDYQRTYEEMLEHTSSAWASRRSRAPDNRCRPEIRHLPHRAFLRSECRGRLAIS